MATFFRTTFLAPALASALALGAIGCKGDIARARAANDFRCPESELEVEQLPGEAFRVRGCGQEATYVCTGGSSQVVGGNGGIVNEPIACIREASSGQTTAASAQQPAPKAANEDENGTGKPVEGFSFPKGVAGFDFGIAKSSAEQACTSAGHGVSKGADERTFQCSQPVASVGFDATVSLSFCEDALCRTDVFSRPEAGEGWATRFLELRQTLEKRYGKPTEVTRKVEDGCASKIATCIAEGKAAFWVTWRWANRDVLTLGMGKVGEQAVIRISYKRGSSEKEPAL